MTMSRLFLIFAAIAVLFLFPYSGFAAEKPRLLDLMSAG